MKHLKQVILVFILLATVSLKAQIVVESGNAESLLEAIDKANHQNVDSTSQRLFVFIPNGVYDLGERTLTQIWGHNIALIGESMEGTIIRNAPSVENEGISKTATLLNRGWNNYVQDLTLKNDLDYYHSGPAGRAVCWQDKGNFTIFKRVRMLSYQDTYYSHSEECNHYFEDSELHGTVDFLCGAGDVYFNHCLIVTEKRNEDGSGNNVIAAPRTSTTKYGYVFNHCTIRNDMSVFAFARGWHTNPRCVWLNTTLETPEKLMATRFDPYGIRSVDNAFFEYNTMDASGRNITPKSNVVRFQVNEQLCDAETIITKKDAKRFCLKKVFPKWRPDKKTRALEKESARMKKQYLKTNL
jgi:pectin methylesterase-like acyl-CoA thioesterase